MLSVKQGECGAIDAKKRFSGGFHVTFRRQGHTPRGFRGRGNPVLPRLNLARVNRVKMV